MEKIVERAKRIILNPKEALTEVRSEEIDIATSMKEYLIYVAAIPPVAQFIGRALVGHPILGRQNFFRSLIFAVLGYAFSLAGMFVFSKIISALAPNFNSVKNDVNAFKLVMYSATPGLVAGVFYVIPSLGMLAILGSLYGIYILYIGLPVLMETPEDKTLIYTVVSIIAGIIVMFVIGAIASAIAFGAGGSTFYM